MDTTIRQLRAEDRSALEAFPDRVSPETARTRFHAPMKMLTPPTLDLLLGLEPGCREAVVAVDENGIAGVARFARDVCGDPASAIAEIAVIVADDRQRGGLGRDLVLALAGLARAAGIETFRATMQEDNDGARRFVGRLAPGSPERFVRNTVVAELPVASIGREF